MVKELGYNFYPARRPSEPGYSRLDILINPKPSELHFDPKSVTLTVYSEQRGLEILTIRYGWMLGARFKTAAGQVYIEDKKGKEVEAFTYGGELTIDSSDMAATRLTLISPAPILGNYSEDSVAAVIAEETQILLAERRSAWEGREDDYERQLGTIEPMALYYACLAALQDRMKPIHMGNDEGKYQVLGKIREEIRQSTRDSGLGADGMALMRIEDIL